MNIFKSSENKKQENDLSSRLLIGLDALSTHIMVTDADFNIQYMNKSLHEMFEKTEDIIQKDLPHFNSKTLIGTNIDIFHKNPAHQRKILNNLSSRFESQLEIGGNSFRIIANPIFDDNNELTGMAVEWADRTIERELEAVNLDYKAQVEAIGRSQAVIQFDLNGNILDANENFLSTVEYSLNEIRGKHHSMFVLSEFKESEEYKEFWGSLRNGEFCAGEFERVGKNGKQIFLQASYNPIFDVGGRLIKIVKYASDITAQKTLQTTVENILSEVSQVMLSLSEGKMNKKVEGEYEGQFENLKIATNNYCKKLSDIVNNIRQVSDLVNNGSEEISSGNMDLSRRTESQASALEETSASMEQLTSTVKNNADNANDANQLAKETRNQAQLGGDVVEKAVKAMNEINQASGKISNIISVIDEIAFQTNLLALNAAVEAARAGEQGRGFAVVATEVRNLAGRSASAAKEIKELIEDSVNKIEEGSHLVNQSGSTLEEIMSSVNKVASIVADITVASEEQALGIEQINKAIIELDTTTQQNSALVEESAAAAESMSEQSYELKELIGFFDTDNEKPSMKERRRSNRPWSNTIESKAPEEPSNDLHLKAVGNAGNNNDWTEF